MSVRFSPFGSLPCRIEEINSGSSERVGATERTNERTKKFALGRKKKVGQKRDRGGGRRWGNLSGNGERNGHFLYRDYIEHYVVSLHSQSLQPIIFYFLF